MKKIMKIGIVESSALKEKIEDKVIVAGLQLSKWLSE